MRKNLIVIRMKAKQTLPFISSLFWLPAIPVPARLKLTFQKPVWLKFRTSVRGHLSEVLGAYLRMGAHSRGRLFIDLPDRVGAYLTRVLIRGALI